MRRSSPRSVVIASSDAPALYLDTSAFVKLVRIEPETPALRAYISATSSTLVSSRLLRTEVYRAASTWAPDRLPVAREQLASVSLLSVDPFCEQAGLLPAAPSRRLASLDAIHLVTAMSLGSDLLALVAYDQQLLASARYQGLPVASPR